MQIPSNDSYAKVIDVAGNSREESAYPASNSVSSQGTGGVSGIPRTAGRNASGQGSDISGPKRVVVPTSIKEHGHWLGISALTLPSSISDAQTYGTPETVSNAISSSMATAGELAGVVNTSGSKLLGTATKVLLPGSALIGVGLSINQLISDATYLAAHPDDRDAQWAGANSAFQTGGTLVAMAASFAFPPAALAPLLFPDVASVGQAETLREQENALHAQGSNVEADAVHSQYVKAALDATPFVDWFSSFYSPGMKPAIESFEASQGNVTGAPPAGELPSDVRGDRRVVDYYGQAMQERLHALESNAKAYLTGIAQREGQDSVTVISRSPQTFGWPSSGQPMRVFDRAVALTYSRDTDSVTGTFFGKDADGTFRLPVLNEGISLKAGKKNKLMVSDMFDFEKRPVKFDLVAYRAGPPGSVSFNDPKSYTF
ncbi:MAG TPA: hypothetical protein VGL08_22480 [Paraburkholderia sp.]|jgi:hypothetical protein